MGIDILKEILDELFDTNTIIDEYVDMLDYNVVFNCLDEIKKQVGVDINKIVNVIFLYAFYLLVLKLVWKCFNIYILKVDGNDEANPMVLLVNFIKAIVYSMGFGILFSYICSIGSEITGKILSSINVKTVTFSEAANMLFDPSLTAVKITFALRLCFGIFTILAIVLTVKFVKSAIELVILRIGISFATVGLLDSDQGMFKPYIKKFYQIAFAVVVQVACFRFSLYAVSKASFIWAFAFISMAMTAPAFLNEFIMTNSGGGGIIQQALYSLGSIRSFAKK